MTTNPPYRYLITYYKLKIKRLGTKQLVAQNYRKIGRPFLYPKILIEFAVILRFVFKADYRRTAVLLEEFTGIEVSKSQLNERVLSLTLDPFELTKSILSKMELEVSIDTTGFKPTDKGVWRVIKHEDGKINIREGFVKFSAVVENKFGFLISAIVGDPYMHDSRFFDNHLEDLSHYKVKSAYLDGAYDSFRIYRKWTELDVNPVIRPRKNGRILYSKTDDHLFTKRDIALKEIKNNGYDFWKIKNKYGQRQRVESVFSAIKRTFGETLRSREGNVAAEFTQRIWVYNQLVAVRNGFKIQEADVFLLIIGQS